VKLGKSLNGKKSRTPVVKGARTHFTSPPSPLLGFPGIHPFLPTQMIPTAQLTLSRLSLEWESAYRAEPTVVRVRLLVTGEEPPRRDTCASTALPLRRPPPGPFQAPPVVGMVLSVAMAGRLPVEKILACSRLVSPRRASPRPPPCSTSSKRLCCPEPTSLQGAVLPKSLLISCAIRACVARWVRGPLRLHVSSPPPP
jgi:hypothetical protein